MRKEDDVAVTGAASCLKKKIKRSAQCHVWAQSPPHRCPNDKYPVNTSHRSDLCKNVPLHPYLVATVIHIQHVHSQICVYVYTHCAQYGDVGRARDIQISGQQ